MCYWNRRLHLREPGSFEQVGGTDSCEQVDSGRQLASSVVRPPPSPPLRSEIKMSPSDGEDMEEPMRMLGEIISPELKVLAPSGASPPHDRARPPARRRPPLRALRRFREVRHPAAATKRVGVATAADPGGWPVGGGAGRCEGGRRS